jgi:hypothetical protein
VYLTTSLRSQADLVLEAVPEALACHSLTWAQIKADGHREASWHTWVLILLKSNIRTRKGNDEDSSFRKKWSQCLLQEETDSEQQLLLGWSPPPQSANQHGEATPHCSAIQDGHPKCHPRLPPSSPRAPSMYQALTRGLTCPFY